MELDGIKTKESATFKQLNMAIKKQCVECFGGVKGEVLGCTSPGCSLYPYRMGVKLKGRSGRVKNLKNVTDNRAKSARS